MAPQEPLAMPLSRLLAVNSVHVHVIGERQTHASFQQMSIIFRVTYFETFDLYVSIVSLNHITILTKVDK